MMGRVTRPPKRPEIRTLVSTTALSIHLLPDLLDKRGDLPFRERVPLHPSIDPSQEPTDSGSPGLSLQSLDEPQFIGLREGIYCPFQISQPDANRYACHDYFPPDSRIPHESSSSQGASSPQPGHGTTFTLRLPI